MTAALHDRFIAPLPHKYRESHSSHRYRTHYYAALALLVLIAYIIQLIVSLTHYSRAEEARLHALPVTGFHIQNTSTVYR